MTWKRTRAFPTSARLRIIRRNPVCQGCGRRPSTIADHVIPVAEGGADDESNGQALCGECHEAKTREEQRRGLARWNAQRPRQDRPAEPHPGLR